MCVGHANSWLQHPLACYKGISCGGPGQPPVPSDECHSDNVYNHREEQCFPSVENCTMTTVIPDSCLSNPCQHGGVCSTPNEGDHTILCNCTSDYTGTFCEKGIFFILFK